MRPGHTFGCPWPDDLCCCEAAAGKIQLDVRDGRVILRRMPHTATRSVLEHPSRKPPTTKPKLAAVAMQEAEAALSTEDFAHAIRTASRVLELAGADYLLRLLDDGRVCRRTAAALVTAARQQLDQPVYTEPHRPAECSDEEAPTKPEALTVLVLGGIGRLETQYRRIVEDCGFSFQYREKGCSWATAPKNLAYIVVPTSVVSHPQREAAERLAKQTGAKMIYLRSASLSALEVALKEKSR